MPALKKQIKLAIRVLLEGHRPQVWGEQDWARIETIRKENAWLSHDNIVGAAVGFGKRGGEKTDTLTLKIYVEQKKALSALASNQRIPRTLSLPEPIGELELDVIDAGKPVLCAAGGNNDAWPTKIGTLGAVLLHEPPGLPARAVIASNAHVFGYKECGLKPGQVIQLAANGRTVGRDIRTRGFRHADGVAILRADVAIATAVRSALPHGTPGLNPKIDRFGRRSPIGAKLSWQGYASQHTKSAIVDDDYFTVRWPALSYKGVDLPTTLPGQMVLEGVTPNDISLDGDSGSAFLTRNAQGEILFCGLLVGRLRDRRIVACPVSQFAQSYHLRPL